MRKFLDTLIWLFIRVAYPLVGSSFFGPMLQMIPPQLIVPMLRRHGANVGTGVSMSAPIIIENYSSGKYRHFENLSLGSQCYIGKDTFLDLADHISIEDNVTISMRVMILTHVHPGKSPLKTGRLKPKYSAVRLCTGCYIGAGAIIMPGVKIGENAIVGAGSVVTRDVLKDTTVIGVPAKVMTKGSTVMKRDPVTSRKTKLP